jgi:hypothetical protein
MMKYLNWKTASIVSTLIVIAALVILVAPAIGQDQKDKDKPPVGLDQARELTDIANSAMKSGKYEDAIHALHSAAFILEEGLGRHGGGPGMMGPGMGHDMGPGMMGPGMNQGQGPMGPGMGMGPMGGPGQQMGRPHDFPTAIQHARTRAAELKKQGADVGDIENRIAEAEKAFKDGKEQDAWQQLKDIMGEMDRISGEKEGKHKGSVDQPQPGNQDATPPGGSE